MNLQVTLCQLSLIWEDIPANLQRIRELIFKHDQHTDIILLPELFSTGFTMSVTNLAETMNGRTISWMKKIAQSRKTILAGSIIIREKGEFYNRLIAVRQDGSSTFYDKRHLFRMSDENEHYSPGNRKMIISAGNWRLCPLICYDLRFPVWSRNRNESRERIPRSFAARVSEHKKSNQRIDDSSQQSCEESQYDVLIYIANWPQQRRDVWRTLLMARAIENNSYVIGINRVGTDGMGIEYQGETMLVNFMGQVIEEFSDSSEEIRTLSLDWDSLQEFRRKFPVHLDADDFTIT